MRESAHVVVPCAVTDAEDGSDVEDGDEDGAGTEASPLSDLSGPPLAAAVMRSSAASSAASAGSGSAVARADAASAAGPSSAAGAGAGAPSLKGTGASTSSMTLAVEDVGEAEEPVTSTNYVRGEDPVRSSVL